MALSEPTNWQTYEPDWPDWPGAVQTVFALGPGEPEREGAAVDYCSGERGMNSAANNITTDRQTRAEKLLAGAAADRAWNGNRPGQGASNGAASASGSTPEADFDVLNDDEEVRKQTILARLAAASHNPNRNKGKAWALERAIARAGELHIREAAPLLVKLLGSGDALRDYRIAWSLGRCGEESVVLALGRLTEDRQRPAFVRRIAREALRQLFDAEIKRMYVAATINQLPAVLRTPARSGPPERFARVLCNYLNDGDERRYAVLETLYQVDNEYVRPALLGLLRATAARPELHSYLHWIQQAAEYRYDEEVLALLHKPSQRRAR